MKYLSLFLALTISLNTFAASGMTEEFERVFDDYQYSMTVEWDQKDEAFLDAKSFQFQTTVKKMLESGLSQAEVESSLLSRIKDKTVLESLKLKAALLEKTSSQEDFSNFLKDASKGMYAKGSSWNGSAVFYGYIALGVLLVFLVAKLTPKQSCQKYEMKPTCWDECDRDGYCMPVCGDTETCTQWSK